MTQSEQPQRWNASGTELVGILHSPADASRPPRAAVLMVHPFAEEKKFSHRVFVNAAREFARRGAAVLRFDLSGCGDSALDTGDATLADWLADIASARAHLAQESGDVPVTLMGLRLGATLALAAQIRSDPVGALVLWEPILNGKKYVDEILRRRMIKEMMTTGKKATGRAEVMAQLEADGFLDMDGIAVGRRLIEDIAAMEAAEAAAKFTGRALCVQIAFNAKVSSGLEALSSAMTAAGAQVTTVGIREQVLWDRVEGVEAPELIATTAEWVEG